MSAVVEIVFDDIITARKFIQWMQELGEQYYYTDHPDHTLAFDYQEAHLRILTTPCDCDDTT